ncbi:hypothetical protein E2C01_048580 [Portunus trituberculatus]|uniref:Uncharacterized protein n=1 Tax=Portunus trituberculatus TaxID=210409 RepID=A0A5B7GBC2_PORTR|nr:hypothetical protein [Portunus trituberculatus]
MSGGASRGVAGGEGREVRGGERGGVKAAARSCRKAQFSLKDDILTSSALLHRLLQQRQVKRPHMHNTFYTPLALN